MNKAIFIILLGMLILAQTSEVTVQEAKSESQEVAEAEPKQENNLRQLLTVADSHELNPLNLYCIQRCMKTHSILFCPSCCSQHTYLFYLYC